MTHHQTIRSSVRPAGRRARPRTAGTALSALVAGAALLAGCEATVAEPRSAEATATTTPSASGPAPAASTPASSPSAGSPEANPTASSPSAGPADGTHVDNPYAGAVGYRNADWAAAVTQVADDTDGDLGRSIAGLTKYPTAVWLDRIAAVTGGEGVKTDLRGHLDAAVEQQRAAGGKPVVITLLVYDLPNRDCAALASNGELTVADGGLEKYQRDYIDPIAAALADPAYADLRIATVIEPDSLPNLVTNLNTPTCAEVDSSEAYTKGVQYALNALHAVPNVYTYLDVAHSGWLGWPDNMQQTVDLVTSVVKGTTKGVQSVDGFVTNTSNYTPLEEPYLPDPEQMVAGQPVQAATFYEFNPRFGELGYATELRSAFIAAGMSEGIGMLVDTSRNGWGGPDRPDQAPAAGDDVNDYVDAARVDRRGHRGNWCNQPGGIGERPTAAPAPGFDAYLWVKPPGESDGTSDSSQTSPDAEGKSFDAMCDPAAASRSNPSVRTGALPDAPPAGTMFPEALRVLVRNAEPAL